MSDASAFSPDYIASRARFRSSASAAGARLVAMPIDQVGPEGEALTIDAALFGAERPERAVVVSSGTHGVEGHFGAAVQAALLEDQLSGWPPPAGLAVVLIHAVNPFGYAWTRRVNEDNVDLNRNFLRAGEHYEGAPEGYADLDGFLNPQSPPPAFELFLPRALLKIARHGLPTLKNAVAGGQYEFPQGVFFGGARPSRTMELLAEHLPTWVGSAHHVLHVDFHTGLGKRGTYKLLVDHERGAERYEWLTARFGPGVEPWEPEQGVSYAIRGGLGTWCKATLPDTEYDVLAAEFGSVHILEVIAAMREENRAHHWGEPDDASTQRAKRRLREAFAPSDRTWRDEVVPKGVRVVEAALQAVLDG